ncbi:MAG: CDP-glucose 4,6-dehydratase, partial [Bacilli bacterium]
KWVDKSDGGPHEAAFLKLDNSKIKKTFRWKPGWHIDECIDMIVEWTRIYFDNKEDIPEEMDNEVVEFFNRKQ